MSSTTTMSLLSCSARDQRAVLNAIKYLANELRVSIIAPGTYEALHVMRGTGDSSAAMIMRRVSVDGYRSRMPYRPAWLTIRESFPAACFDHDQSNWTWQLGRRFKFEAPRVANSRLPVTRA